MNKFLERYELLKLTEEIQNLNRSIRSKKKKKRTSNLKSPHKKVQTQMVNSINIQRIKNIPPLQSLPKK